MNRHFNLKYMNVKLGNVNMLYINNVTVSLKAVILRTALPFSLPCCYSTVTEPEAAGGVTLGNAAAET